VTTTTAIPRLPRYPHLRPAPAAVLAAGLCTTHPHPDWWTAAGRAQREAARHVCLACPALAPCHAWAVQAIPGSDQGIYAATGPVERARLRRQDRCTGRPPS
jgi:hypothetical protein